MIKFKPRRQEKKPAESGIISIRIKFDRLKQIDKIASQFDISRNELILQCIDFALDNFSGES